jgi:stress-induced morphogen
MTAENLRSRIETLAAGTYVEVTDLTGTEDHYQALVVSSAFEGKSMIQQHQLCFQLLKEELDSGSVHALTLKTFTPAQYRK